MLSDEVVRFFQSGCPLLVGCVSAEGEPHAARAWGVAAVDAPTNRLWVVLPADDPVLLDTLGTTGAMALTGADVRTLRSMQAKGRLRGIAAATPADRDAMARYCEAFFSAVEEVDGVPRSLPDRLVPSDVVVGEFAVSELYDQSPGPGAGAGLPVGATTP